MSIGVGAAALHRQLLSQLGAALWAGRSGKPVSFRIGRPRRTRKGSKKTAVEIKPPVQDGVNNSVVVRQNSNVQVISGKFLGDFQRHYAEKGYKIFDWVLETNPASVP